MSEKCTSSNISKEVALLVVNSWVVAQTLVISKNVRTRQTFCAHRLQNIRGNIAYMSGGARDNAREIFESLVRQTTTQYTYRFEIL